MTATERITRIINRHLVHFSHKQEHSSHAGHLSVTWWCTLFLLIDNNSTYKGNPQCPFELNRALRARAAHVNYALRKSRKLRRIKRNMRILEGRSPFKNDGKGCHKTRTCRRKILVAFGGSPVLFFVCADAPQVAVYLNSSKRFAFVLSWNILIFYACDAFSGVLTTRIFDKGSYEDCTSTANVRNVSASWYACRITTGLSQVGSHRMRSKLTIPKHLAAENLTVEMCTHFKPNIGKVVIFRRNSFERWMLKKWSRGFEKST